MKLSEMHTDMILVDRSGNRWRTTAVNPKADKPSFLADMVEPGNLNGAASVTGAFREEALHNFERCIEAIS
jgi:hypothetical protein